jgi:hypothetical protein
LALIIRAFASVELGQGDSPLFQAPNAHEFGKRVAHARRRAEGLT